MTDLTDYVAGYLTSVGSGNWDNDSVTKAIAAERRAQAQVCKIPYPRTVEATTTAGSGTVTLTDGTLFTSLDIGATVTGDGIPDDTMVLAVDCADAVVSEAATVDGTEVTLTVTPDTSDLDEALARRVAANLANRNLPLGIQTQVAEFGSTANRVGGRDREVMRLEGPYRIVLV